MKNLTIIFALFVSCLIVSCQKETLKITPNNTKHSGAKLLEVAADPSYYSINYNDHGSILVSQYKKRARKNSIPTGSYDGLTISEVVNRSIYGTSVQRDIAGTVIADLNSTSYLPITVDYDNKTCVIYRGGSTFIPNAPTNAAGTNGDYRLTANGLVSTAYGLSCEVNVNANSYLVNNGAYQITYLPAGLKIIKRGTSLTHYEIVPTQEITVQQYNTLCSQIQKLPSF
jgi:hypothetical protein